jgi:imidazole glycerol-phosphate synthase subunit HisH
MIGIINLGNSNLASLTNSFDYLGVGYGVVEEAGHLDQFEKIVLPGVGTFGKAMQVIKERNLFSEIKHEVETKGKPFLGICLGLQLLFDSSEENLGVKGLSLIQGNVVKIPASIEYSIPRIGWAQSLSAINFLGLSQGEQRDFYYIHSYHAEPFDKNIVAISTEGLTGAVKSQNVYGCQFHPEKSHLSGLKMLKAFSELDKIS